MAPKEEIAPLVNAMPLKRFPALLDRILERLAASPSTEFFDQGEAARLADMLKCQPRDLRRVCDFCAFVFESAAYAMERPEKLEARLGADHGIDEAHATALAAAWKDGAAAYVAALRERPVAAPTVLESTDWSTRFTLADSSGAGPTNKATGLVELKLAKPGGQETLAVECSHAELYDLFKTLNEVQASVDGLTG
mmetsp:Transcript_21120/g.64958  ORF Transcript_21120/g.64958 Transcript_21120/m.64958 type:complete len:195 (+) Transcript_21120:289-873(+)